MNKNIKFIKGILLIVIAIISIIFSIKSFERSDYGTWVSQKEYGGDAYTGIQNAAASTAANVNVVNRSVSFGFGAILLIVGLTLGVVGGEFIALYCWGDRNDTQNSPTPLTKPAPQIRQADVSSNHTTTTASSTESEENLSNM